MKKENKVEFKDTLLGMVLEIPKMCVEQLVDNAIYNFKHPRSKEAKQWEKDYNRKQAQLECNTPVFKPIMLANGLIDLAKTMIEYNKFYETNTKKGYTFMQPSKMKDYWMDKNLEICKKNNREEEEVLKVINSVLEKR